MTKKDLFILAIKLFGLNVIVITLFSSIPSSIISSFKYFELTTILWMIVVLVVFAGLFWLLVFKADWVVEFLKLDKGFSDERIELGNLNASDIAKVGIFIIGGLLITRHIPSLLSNLYWVVKQNNLGQDFNHKEKFNLVVSVINVLLGYLLMTNYEFVADKFKPTNTKEN